MLAVLVVSSLTVVVTSTMVMGQGQTRRDQSFEQALQIADTGMNRMVSLIESRAKVDSDFCVWSSPTTPPAPPCPMTTTPGYVGSADFQEANDQWVLESWGTAAGRTRKIHATVPLGSPFTHAPLGRNGLVLNGGNRADSYRSGSFSTTTPRTFSARRYADYLDTANVITDKTGQGFFATEGRLNLNGQTFSNSDGAEIYYTKNPGYRDLNYVANPLPGAIGICESVTDTCEGHWVKRDGSQPLEATLADGRGNRKLLYYAQQVKMRPIRVPFQPTGHFDGNGQTLGPSVNPDGSSNIYVFRSAKLYSNTVIQGTPTNPTVIYLTGELTAPAHARINFEPDPDPASTLNGILRPRPAASLLIYSVMSGTAIQLPTGVQIAGGIYAPNGEFSGGSQGEIFGALVADVIRTTGGWKFHYDVTMGELKAKDLKAVDWVELGG